MARLTFPNKYTPLKDTSSFPHPVSLKYTSALHVENPWLSPEVVNSAVNGENFRGVGVVYSAPWGAVHWKQFLPEQHRPQVHLAEGQGVNDPENLFYEVTGRHLVLFKGPGPKPHKYGCHLW